MINALESARESLASIHPQLPVAALAVLVGALIWLLKVVWPEGFARLPKKAQAYPALVLGAVLGALSGTGDPMAILSDALFGGLLGGVTAVGGHHAGKRIKGSSGVGKAGLVSLVLCAALVLPGCALFRSVSSYLTALEDEYGDEFAEVVEIVCSRSEAKARGIDQREALDEFCRTQEQLDPYVQVALEAMQRGESRAARAVERGDQ